MLHEFTVPTQKREQFIDITSRVEDIVRQSGFKNGAITLFVPHTTAAVTINENADPSVVQDMLLALDKAFPNLSQFRHAEGNSTAHVKSSVIGCCLTVLIDEGRLVLGTWQGIYFCEFDGPRTRKCIIQIP